MKTGKALADEIRGSKPEFGTLNFWWLGQMGFAIKTMTATLLIDPFLTPSEKRLVPPLATPEELEGVADLIICTHDHSDHVDRPALPRLLKANPKAKLIIPRAIAKQDSLGAAPGQLVGLDDSERFEIGVEAAKITALKAAHELLVRNERGYLNLSFVIESGGATILHTGDACVYEGLQTALKKWRFTLAVLPINGRDAVRLKRGCIGNMTYQEAADLAGSLEPALTVPGHFEMFAGNSVDPQLFADYMAVKYPKLRVMIPKHGEKTELRAC